MARYWFRPKTYGYGATPANWKGWAATLAFVAVLFAVTWRQMIAPALAHVGPVPQELAIWLGVQAVLIAGFIALCHAKTEGGWKWRWGGKE